MTVETPKKIKLEIILEAEVDLVESKDSINIIYPSASNNRFVIENEIKRQIFETLKQNQISVNPNNIGGSILIKLPSNLYK